MKTFIELWSARQSWLDLPQKERVEYMAQLSPGLKMFAEAGVEFGAWGKNDATQDHRGNYTFFAIWKFPNEELILQLENILAEAKWYDYFDQQNISGSSQTPQEVIGMMIEMS